MKIQWFPGHMTKAMRMMESQVKGCDGIIYVLDARCPASSYNKKLKGMFGSKPVIYVLCKADLADENVDKIVAKIKKTNACVKINAFNKSSKKALENVIASAIKEKKDRYAQKSCDKIFRFMVVGVPNTGKSTIINMLAGSKRAITGDKAGVTRGKQWITCDGFELLDTPGTCPPAFENETFATRLAFVGSINDDILAMDDLAIELLNELKARYPQKLFERYELSQDMSAIEMLDGICKRRGFVLRGGEYDYERACRAIIDDFRSCKIAKVCFDSLEDVDVFA